MIEKSFNDFEVKTERCILIGLVLQNQSKWEVIDHIEELKALAETSGAETVDAFIQNKVKQDPAYLIGKGKLEEIALFIEMQEIDLVIFDDELSPAQIKNIENILKIKVIDRTALILDIFADHAKSNEAKVQVELAQLNYILPRLTRQWQHLSRQVGGIGTKGPGETQLETDRRLVRTRISNLKKQLEKISSQKKTQRRQRESLFRAALIGYTNAGKSTIMNALTDSDVLIENKLFATLDTTVRRLELNSRINILLSDTVGFIRKLPHHLVASFRTTLAETLEADLLLHVIDVTHPSFNDHIEVVNQILNEMELDTKYVQLIFNKVDAIKNRSLLDQIRFDFPGALFISARKRIGIAGLKKRLLEILETKYETEHFQLRHNAGVPLHLFHTLGTVIDERFDEDYLYLDVKYPVENKTKIFALYEKYK